MTCISEKKKKRANRLGNVISKKREFSVYHETKKPVFFRLLKGKMVGNRI